MENIKLEITEEERWLLYQAVVDRIADVRLKLIKSEVEYHEIDKKEQELNKLVEITYKLA